MVICAVGGVNIPPWNRKLGWSHTAREVKKLLYAEMCVSDFADILPVDIAFLCGMTVLLVLAAVSACKMHKIHYVIRLSYAMLSVVNVL